MLHTKIWSYALDSKHGFGILSNFSANTDSAPCFFEDGTLENVRPSDVYMDNSVNNLLAEGSGRGHYYNAKETRLADTIAAKAVCTFSRGKENSLQAVLSHGSEKVTITVSLQRYSYATSCSCGKPRCIHPLAAGRILNDRINGLIHSYVITDHPVDKSLFLDPELRSAVGSHTEGELSTDLVESILAIIRLVDSAHSGDYYRRFHNFLLDLKPYYDYDSRFLEDSYGYLLTALFDDPGYRKAVLEPGSYADPEEYEGRQHRSNRTSFKRVLKSYNTNIKELSKDNYSEDTYKEFLLKYRMDLPRLLRYFARGKSKLEKCDLPYLKEIAALPADYLKDLKAAAAKLDLLSGDKEAVAVFRLLAARIPAEEVADFYQGLRNLTISMEELHKLSPTDRQKVINNIPLSKANFCHIMDHILRDADDRVKGAFILRSMERITNRRDTALKNAIVEETLCLADNRLLLVYVLDTLNIKGNYIAAEGDPGRELTSYFDCRYTFVNENSKFHCDFTIVNPEADEILLSVREEDGKLYNIPTRYSHMSIGTAPAAASAPVAAASQPSVLNPGRAAAASQPSVPNPRAAAALPTRLDSVYATSLIREVCLRGREREYQAALEKNQDAVDAFLFEKKHKQFASEYRQLCDSFSDSGKILLAQSQKAEIDWLVYREDGSNALAFRIGNTRKYVVKDALEFLKAFKAGQTTEYGKDLILTHDTDNLEENDAAAIRLLLTARYTKGRRSDKNNKRYITINDSLLSGLLELLSGRSILYNDAPCILRMETREVRLKVSGRYVLSTDIDRSEQEFLNLIGKGYLLTRQPDGTKRADDTKLADGAARANGTWHNSVRKAGGAQTSDGTSLPDAPCVMDRVAGSADEIGLIDLAYRNPSVSVKPILRDFQKNIYARFFEMIDVDQAVRPEFERSKLRLNTYFDLEKSAITVRTVILRDGQEIPADALTSRLDLAKLELLDNYLTSLGFIDKPNGTKVLTDDAHVLAFFKLDFGRMKSLTNVYLSEELQKKELKSVGKPVIRVAYNNNIVSVFLEKSEYSEAELEKIAAGLRRKKKYIMLDGDRIIDLDSEAARDLGDAIQDFGMDPKDLYKKKKVSFITAIKAFSHQKSCRVDKYLRDMIEEIRSFKEADITPPALTGTLREYQEEGFKWMSVLAKYSMGGILADDMGLGKTIQVIALIKADRSRKPSLVVCPKSLVLNWVSEFAKFDGTTGVTAIYGPESRRSEVIASIDYRKKWVYITSYDSLRNDIAKYTGQFCYGILDEAQYIKNVHARKTQSVKELDVLHRFALTGTPIENSIIDLWSIFDYTMPGYLDELSKFRDASPDAIARKVAPFILRRVKEDVLEDLPPKYERILSAEMTSGQHKVYESMRLEAQKALESGGKAFDLLPYLTRLRQVCVDPGMFLDGYTGGSGKMGLLSDLITEYLEQGHRILIFSQFVKALEAVEAMLAKKSIPVYFLSGSTPAQDRMDMMDSFNNGSGTDVFLISLKAGGTGLNLTGADTVIHLDPWWNVAAENQASDRTHRIGQTKNVEVIKLIAEGSIEQRVVELQDIKKEVIRQVISDDDGSVTSAKLEDIAFVLS